MTKLQEFFHRYASLSMGGDPTKLAELYDTSFVAAGPKGGTAFKNDESFLAWLREVRTFNDTSGMTSLTVADVGKIPISASYLLARVTWVTTFERTDATPIRFTISYLLREAESQLKIAAYISDEDQEDVMRAHGLL